MTITHPNIISIHGKDYMTVAGRLQLAHDSKKAIEITTEVLYQEPVVIRATVRIDGRVFTGISAANPAKLIEKQSPYEVAETSAVGRALGFAGFGAVDSIASDDEMDKAEAFSSSVVEKAVKNTTTPPHLSSQVKKVVGSICQDCGVGTIVLNPKTNLLFCDQKCWLNPTE